MIEKVVLVCQDCVKQLFNKAIEMKENERETYTGQLQTVIQGFVVLTVP